MKPVNFKKEINSGVEEAVAKVSEALKKEGFGVLSRIDFHVKMKEKLNKDISPVVILGACNPSLAFEAFQKNTDITSLVPCNAVVRDLGRGKVSVELAKPTIMMEMLGEEELAALAQGADQKLQKVLEAL